MPNGKGDTFPVSTNDFQKSNGLTVRETGFKTVGPSMTRQEFAAECDINTIMSQYDKFLADPMMNLRAQNMQYLDLDAVPQTLMESMEILKQGEEAFYRLPAAVRREFDNDPVAFVDYALDPTNLDQMRDWGLAPPKPAEPAVAELARPAPQAPAEPVAAPAGPVKA